LAVYYLDTSALVKLYVQEAGTERMLRLANPSGGHTLAILGLTRIEFRAAVRKRERAGDVARDTADQLITRMEGHLASIYLVQPLTDLVVEEAAALLDRHALRAYDAVQLAGCALLRAGRDPVIWHRCWLALRRTKHERRKSRIQVPDDGFWRRALIGRVAAVRAVRSVRGLEPERRRLPDIGLRIAAFRCDAPAPCGALADERRTQGWRDVAMCGGWRPNPPTRQHLG
jgi:hypothetical protein